MRSIMKRMIVFGLSLSLVGVMGLAPVQLGRLFSSIAQADQWSPPVLIQVVRIQRVEGNQNGVFGSFKIETEDGESFPLDPKATFKNDKGQPVLLSSFTAPSKVRLLLDKGTVKAMILIEALPR